MIDDDVIITPAGEKAIENELFHIDNTERPLKRPKTQPYEIAAQKILDHAKEYYLTIDQHSFTGVMLDAILEVYIELLEEMYKIFSYPLFPANLDQSVASRIKLHILSKILGTYSFAFPSGVVEKFLGILDKGASVPGNVTHGIPEEDPGGQILPTSGNPISFNLVTVDKAEFKTLLIGQGMLQGGLVTYDGLLYHVASFLECDVSKVSIEVETPRKVKISAKVPAPIERVKVYNKFFAGAISHTGVNIELVQNNIL